MSAVNSFAQVLVDADLLVERAEIDQAIATMANRIADDYLGEMPVYLTVMNGGLPFAGQLSLELGVRGLDLQFDYLHASRYRGSTSGGELIWKQHPTTPLMGRRVLLVDDILDEGHTLLGIQRWCLEQGALDARIATLVVKQHERCVVGVKADYVGVEVVDRYVFGFGMDYHEHGRNLPAIYAVKGM